MKEDLNLTKNSLNPDINFNTSCDNIKPPKKNNFKLDKDEAKRGLSPEQLYESPEL